MQKTLPAPPSANDVLVDSPCSDYLLICRVQSFDLTQGKWHFALESADGSPVFSASDEDMGDLNRLTLLAAVRGLESIEGASSVTLLSSNRYVIRSLTDSLPRWRASDFVWEHFGRRIDVQHADLWRRIDRALSIHRVEACLVCSQRVSDGIGKASVAGHGNDEQRRLRIDSPHPFPSRRDSGSGVVGPDHLRRWLLGGGASAGTSARRHRFTTADLLRTA